VLLKGISGAGSLLELPRVLFSLAGSTSLCGSLKTASTPIKFLAAKVNFVKSEQYKGKKYQEKACNGHISRERLRKGKQSSPCSCRAGGSIESIGVLTRRRFTTTTTTILISSCLFSFFHYSVIFTFTQPFSCCFCLLWHMIHCLPGFILDPHLMICLCTRTDLVPLPPSSALKIVILSFH